MRARAVLVVLALLLSACGSRVGGQQQAGVQATGGGAADDGLSMPSGTGDVQATGSTVVDAQGNVVAVRPGSSAGPSSAGGGRAVSSAASSGGELTASAPGVTATAIKIGLIYDKSAGTTNAALGYTGIGQVNYRRMFDALIADVNDNGGILGRKLQPVYFEFDSAGADAATSLDVLEQRACTTFTENRVFAAFYGGDENFTRCMNKIHAVRISFDGVDDKLLAESPELVVLNVNLDRAAAFVVDRLHALDYYAKTKEGTPGAKIGIVRYDKPQFETAARVMKEHLAAHGLQVTDEVAIRQAESNDQIADETNATRAAALKFKTDGITHVQFIGTGSAFLELIFMQNAEKQLYRPRYGMASWDGGQALATLLGGDAAQQLKGALEVGWFPIFDVHRTDYEGDKTTKAFQRCIAVLEKAGETFTSGDPTRNKEAIAASYCDEFNYFAAAARLAGTNLTPDTFMQQGVRQVDGLDSAATFVLTTTKRRDALGGVRDGKFLDDCTCFRYLSPTVTRV